MGDYDEKTKRVLLLGAGYVSAPVVEYLTRSNDIAVSVGNRSSFSIFVFKRIFIIYENENANVFSISLCLPSRYSVLLLFLSLCAFSNSFSKTRSSLT